MKDIYPVCANNLELIAKLLLTGKGTIKYTNGLVLGFNSDKPLIARIGRVLHRLERMKVRTESDGRILRIYIYDTVPKFVVPLYRFSKQEIYSLLGLIYFCLRNCVAINPDKDIASKITSHITIDIGEKIVTTQEGIKFGLDAIDPVIFAETFILKIHDVFAENLDGKTVLDAGAAFGDTALYFASKGATVFAAEPIEQNVRAMERNIGLNPKLRSQIKTVAAAIGRNGFLDMTRLDSILDCDAVPGEFDPFPLRSIGTERVPSYSISSLCDKLGLKGIDYLKADVKGAEHFFTERNLKRIRMYLKIETNRSRRLKFRRLTSRIKEAGFEQTFIGYAPAEEIKSETGGGMICGVNRMRGGQYAPRFSPPPRHHKGGVPVNIMNGKIFIT